MMSNQPKQAVLIVGLFLSEKNKHKIQRTPADQLAELFTKHGLQVVTTSKFVPRLARLMDTISTIFFKRSKYSIAIVPLYGGFRSFVWEAITVSLLKKLNKKIVLIAHGGAIPERMKTRSAKYLATMSKADQVVCPSGFLAAEFGKYNLPCTIIENVINLQEYHFHAKQTIRPHILWMRAFEHPYNPLMAVEVLASIKQQHPQASMVMAGFDFGMLQQTKALAMQLGVLDAIEFPGYIANEQKNKYANECDVYICTNKIDNAPISIIEMMALGVPVVTVNSGGIPYLVNDKHDCLMVEDDDVEDMAKKILYLIGNPEKAVALMNNASISAGKFGEDAVIKKWQSLLEQLSN
jgi:glycosyltransferase involved in cell wall biosynthesis